jgi:hypothetical protein
MNSAADVLRSVLGREVQVISTIDHPSPSPPIDLFDGHLRLQRRFGDSVLLMNWDVSQPSERFYRYHVITDTGLISKQPKLYHYQIDVPYHEQSFSPTPWALMPQCIEVAVAAIQARQKLPQSVLCAITNRAHEVVAIAKESFGSGLAPWAYTRRLLENYYERLAQPQLQSLIRDQYANYWLSPMMTQWIPWCITNVKGAMAFENLLAKGIFKRTPIRHRLNAEGVDVQAVGIAQLADLIARSQVIPSLDVFLWSLAVARIQHYGNDFEFFQRLGALTGDSTIAELQLTREGEDCVRFLQLKQDYGVLLDIDEHGGVQLSSRSNNPSKITRISSFSSVFVAAGESAMPLLQRYARGEFEHVWLDLGERLG